MKTIIELNYFKLKILVALKKEWVTYVVIIIQK